MGKVTSVWIAWKEVTQFYGSARIAFETEKSARLVEGEIRNVRLESRDSIGKFEIDLDEHLTVIRSEETICSVVLLASYSVFENFGRTILGIPDDGELKGGVEQWGDVVLKKSGCSFDSILGKKAGIAEIAAIRNIYAHGNKKVDQSMINRIQNAGGSCIWSLGQHIQLDHAKIQQYRSRLKSFMRIGEGA